jgi:hypothetical protein
MGFQTATRAIGKKASDIGWNDVPRLSPISETIYKVIRSG